jgi:hypothetical protein
VKAVEETDLPAGVPWAFVRTGDGAFMFMKRSMFDNPDEVCAVLLRVRDLANLVVQPAPLKLVAG